MVGILVSFWDDLFSGAMLVSGRVSEEHGLVLIEYGWSQLKPRPNWQLTQGIACTWHNVQTLPPVGTFYAQKSFELQPM